MSDQSKIQWTDSTGGPWLVCSEVSPGCAHCYARELIETRLAPLIRKAYRSAGFQDWETRPLWGDSAPRVLSKGFWSDVRRFNKQPWICDACGMAHAMLGQICMTSGCDCETQHRRRVFPSLIDWLDDMPAGIMDQDGKPLEPLDVFLRFLDEIRINDQITFILCTKRPQVFQERLEIALLFHCQRFPHDGPYPQDLMAREQWLIDWINGHAPKNVVVLTTVESEKQIGRMDDLRKIPAACRGVSFEPLLSEIIVPDWTGISWGIIGGESGPEARPCNVNWIRRLLNDGRAAGVAMLVKQLGASPTSGPINKRNDPDVGNFLTWLPLELKDKKGGDINEWPEDLRVREWPKGF